MQLLPIFPLEIVVFPGETIPLHIYEKRYIKLVVDILEKDKIFGILPVIEKKISSTGTSIIIDHIVSAYQDGRMDILCRGLQPFKVIRLIASESPQDYHTANISWIDQNNETSLVLQEQALALYYEFHRYIQTPSLPDIRIGEDILLSYQLAHTSGLNFQQQIFLLEIPEESARLDFIIHHLHKIIEFLKGIENTKQKLQQNSHFRIFPELNFDFNI
jgi:Lon protease-like protein